VLLLLRLDGLASQRGDGLHPVLRERLLGLAGYSVPREPMTVADRPKDCAKEKEKLHRATAPPPNVLAAC
jgi:hypothetical protein